MLIGLLSMSVVYLCSFDADMDDLDDDEPVDDIENPEVFASATLLFSYCQRCNLCCDYLSTSWIKHGASICGVT